jgi:hypothetical protein
MLILASACSSKVAPLPEYVPAADLLDVVKDFQRLAKEDLYRFPIPKDVTGINIMKATLIRLSDYEQKNPGRFSDIVDFSKAVAYERLRDYDQAIAHYRRVAGSLSRLAPEAAKNIEALESFQRILAAPIPDGDALAYVKALDEKVGAWNEMIHKYQSLPYGFLARIEEERIDRAKVAFVQLNRHRLAEGSQLVVLGYSQLISKHRESKNLYRHLLDFGDFYATLAREYTLQNDPEGLAFDPEAFDRLAKPALKLYADVAQTDGIVEKLEAQGKIEALRGLAEKVRRLSQ